MYASVRRFLTIRSIETERGRDDDKHEDRGNIQDVPSIPIDNHHLPPLTYSPDDNDRSQWRSLTVSGWWLQPIIPFWTHVDRQIGGECLCRCDVIWRFRYELRSEWCLWKRSCNNVEHKRRLPSVFQPPPSSSSSFNAVFQRVFACLGSE